MIPGRSRAPWEIAERCNFSLDEIRYRYPSEQLPDGTTSAEWLRRQVFHWRAAAFWREQFPTGS